MKNYFSQIKNPVRKIKHPLRYYVASAKDFINTLREFNLIKLIGIIIGITFTGALFVYLVERGSNEAYKNYFDSIWYTVVTLTTTGYGDKFPTTFWGRVGGIFLMCSGVVTMSLLTGNIASFLVEAKLRGKSMSFLSQHKGLFIICGWKNDMELLLRDILTYNKELDAEDLVIIANVHEESVSKLKNLPQFSKINFVKGDFHSETILRSINLANSKKIMVLADLSHRSESPTETDSKTVMSVITIKSIAPTSYVCAELLSRSFEQYLRIAMCDEIIFSKEYSRTLLANASNSVGITHVIYELLDVDTGANLVTTSIPDQYIGLPYSDYRQYVRNCSNDILIGILENTGSVIEMKKHSIREAQKTADMAKLVENLKRTKNLEGNKPFLNPPGEYLIPPHAMGIFIAGSSYAKE